MALVTIVGFPCCGKSTRAKQIKEYLEKRIGEETEGPKLSVVLVDDDNSHVPRSTYDSKSQAQLNVSFVPGKQRVMLRYSKSGRKARTCEPVFKPHEEPRPRISSHL